MKNEKYPIAYLHGCHDDEIQSTYYNISHMIFSMIDKNDIKNLFERSKKETVILKITFSNESHGTLEIYIKPLYVTIDPTRLLLMPLDNEYQFLINSATYKSGESIILLHAGYICRRFVAENDNSAIHEISWIHEDACGFANLFGEAKQKLFMEFNRSNANIGITDLRDFFYRTKYRNDTSLKTLNIELIKQKLDMVAKFLSQKLEIESSIEIIDSNCAVEFISIN